MVREVDVAAPVVAYLEERGWDVYQEVRFGGPGDPVADIVGRLTRPSGGSLVWVVEAKKSMTLALLAQAFAWTRNANFVSVATPHLVRGEGRTRALVKRVLATEGIGWLAVGGRTAVGKVWEDVSPRLRRFPRKEMAGWDRALAVEQKSFSPAGSSGGGYWTPFKQTCESLRRHVQDHPGCRMAEAVKAIRHHYRRDSTATSSLLAMLFKGVIKGIECRTEGGSILLYPT